MDEQRVPNLEELDEQQAQHFLAELFSHLSAEEEYQIRHEDYTLEMPQSGERIRGREAMRAMQEAFPHLAAVDRAPRQPATRAAASRSARRKRISSADRRSQVRSPSGLPRFASRRKPSRS